MELKQKYELYGYLEFVPINIGFVTPIFINNNLLFFEVSNDYTIDNFLQVDDAYRKLVVDKYNGKSITVQKGDKCIYAFKKLDKLYYANDKPLVEFFIKSLLEQNVHSILKEISEKFISKYYVNEYRLNQYIKGQTVFAMFEKQDEAQQAIDQLLNNEFVSNNIDLLLINLSSKSDDSNQSISWKVDSRINAFFNYLFDYSYEAEVYSAVCKKMSALVTVHTRSNEESNQAMQFLDAAGAVSVDEKASKLGYLLAGNSNTKNDSPIGEMQEKAFGKPNLNLDNNTVETGGVRVRKSIFQRLGEEVPVVHKEARVVEEIRLNKDTSKTEETIHDTLRSTEVDMENTESEATWVRRKNKHH